MGLCCQTVQFVTGQMAVAGKVTADLVENNSYFYCIVLLYHSLYFDCITVRFVLLHYATCIGLGY